MWTIDKNKVGQLPGERQNFLPAAVGGTIVDNDNTNILVSLFAGTVNGFAYKP